MSFSNSGNMFCFQPVRSGRSGRFWEDWFVLMQMVTWLFTELVLAHYCFRIMSGDRYFDEIIWPMVTQKWIAESESLSRAGLRPINPLFPSSFISIFGASIEWWCIAGLQHFTSHATERSHIIRNSAPTSAIWRFNTNSQSPHLLLFLPLCYVPHNAPRINQSSISTEANGREMATVMAASARSSVFLPTVKCSNCNAKIEISLMGEHVCSQGTAQSYRTLCTIDILTIAVATVPEFQFLPLNGLFSPSFSSASNPPSSVKLIAVPQSWADTTEAGTWSTLIQARGSSGSYWQLKCKIRQLYPSILTCPRWDRLALQTSLLLLLEMEVGHLLTHRVVRNSHHNLLFLPL